MEGYQVKRIPFDQPLWRPEEFLGPKGIEVRDSLVLAIDRMDRERQLGRRLRVSEGEEFRAGYLKRLREKIAPKPEAEEPLQKLYRLVGDSR